MSSETDLQYGAVQNFVAGEWQSPDEDGQTVVNPATDEPITHVGFSSADAVDNGRKAGND